MRMFPGAICALALINAVHPAPAKGIELTPENEARCLEVLRAGLASAEFWPSMHAAEGLSLGGHGAEVTAALLPKLATETDGQKRCGLARELVRAGDHSKTSILLELLAAPDPYAHVHAAESLFKVNQIGDGGLLRAALADRSNAPKAMMAAAALTRWGSGDALAYLRESLQSADPAVAKLAAWVLGFVGDASDVEALKAGVARFDDPGVKSFFLNALACQGDPEGIQKLAANLKSDDAEVRAMAANFAGEIGLPQVQEDLMRLLNDEKLDVRVRSAQALFMMAKPVVKLQGVVTNDPFPATKANPRYSEGDITVLNDGRYLFGVTEFMGNTSDFAKAHLVGRISSDGGQSWGEQTLLQENVGGVNVMSLTFQALDEDTLGLFYLIGNSMTDLNVFLRRSTDGGLTFGAPAQVTNLPGYHVMNNDRVIRLKTGRILAPTASTADAEKEDHYVCRMWISDDAGATWRAGTGTVDYGKRGAMEPEVLQMNDGRVLMTIRTQLGHIAAAWSSDGGDTWGAASDWGVRAPEAPSTLRRIPSTGDLMLIWNDTLADGEGHGGKRTPLTVAISKDEGKTWEHKKNLEDSQDFTYAYISATFDSGRVALTYYVCEEAAGRISSRFRSVPISWLYE